MRYLESTPTYRIRCADDFEGYWRQNKYWKTVKNKRNRCQDFVLAVNSPGAAEWTIRHWEAKWRDNPDVESPSLSDRLVVAKYLENRGQHHTLILLDQDTPIAGATLTVHYNDLVAGVIYREPGYDWHGIGVRIIDLTFSFAAESGFETMDLGGGHDYKKYWAPQEGERWWFNVCPESLYRAKQVVSLAHKVRGKVANLTPF
jgi:hypothetical protein